MQVVLKEHLVPDLVMHIKFVDEILAFPFQQRNVSTLTSHQ